MGRKRRPKRGPEGLNGPYYILDGDTVVYDGDRIIRALGLMKKLSDHAQLFKIEERKSKEGEVTLVHVLLAFRKGVPAPPAEPMSRAQASF